MSSPVAGGGPVGPGFRVYLGSDEGFSPKPDPLLLTQVGELSDEPPRLEEILEWLLAGGLVNKTGPQNKPGFFDSLRARWETPALLLSPPWSPLPLPTCSRCTPSSMRWATLQILRHWRLPSSLWQNMKTEVQAAVKDSEPHMHVLVQLLSPNHPVGPQHVFVS